VRAVAGIAGVLFTWVTLWSAWRFLIARDPMSEVSAGVWWIGGMVFCGALFAVAVLGGRRATEKGKP
jgi:hypothetical protein